MKLSQIKKEELELYSYTDLAEMILKESKKSLNTVTIFKKICKLLGLSEDEYENKISDFYTAMTTDKNFVLLENGNWDLRDHHPVQTLALDDEELEEEIEEELEEEIEEELEESLDDVSDDDDDLDDEELTIISEEELEED